MNCEQCENFKAKEASQPKPAPKHYAGEPFAANPDYEYTGDERIPEEYEQFENAFGMLSISGVPISRHINGGKRWILRRVSDKPATTITVGMWVTHPMAKEPFKVDSISSGGNFCDGNGYVYLPSSCTPWTPKVGEWVYYTSAAYEGIVNLIGKGKLLDWMIAMVDGKTRVCDFNPELSFTYQAEASTRQLRPLLAPDWERDVAGFKVTAMEVDHERIRMCINGEFFTATIPSVAGGLEVTRELCRRVGIPIKPKGVE